MPSSFEARVGLLRAHPIYGASGSTGQQLANIPVTDSYQKSQRDCRDCWPLGPKSLSGGGRAGGTLCPVAGTLGWSELSLECTEDTQAQEGFFSPPDSAFSPLSSAHG